MIICRRPITVYDVDLAGFFSLGVIAALAYYLVAMPLQDRFGEYRTLSARQLTVEAMARQTGNRVRAVEAEVAQLNTTVAELIEQAPQTDSLPRFLNRATDLAERARLEVSQVVPQATRNEGEYIVADVQMSGRGRSIDFIKFLDTLAREDRYHTLQQFSITRSNDGQDERCALSWTLRLYMLPAEPRSGGTGATL